MVFLAHHDFGYLSPHRAFEPLANNGDTGDMTNLFGQNEIERVPTRFAQIAPERGLEFPQGLTYGIPDDMTDLRVGDRVAVPLGKSNRQVPGFVIDITDQSELDTRKIKFITHRQGRSINLPDDLLELAKWISAYYCCPIGMVFSIMMPPAVKRSTGLVKRIHVELADGISSQSLGDIIKKYRLPQKQKAVLAKTIELAADKALPIDIKDLAHAAGAKTIQPVQQLISKKLLHPVEKSIIQPMRDIWAEQHIEKPKKLILNAEQRDAVNQLTTALASGFSANLLHGVTSSGKTEVYIRVIETAIAMGRTAMMLVPEIALTPQTVGRLIGRFDSVAVLHSGLTAAQRNQQWQSIRDGTANIVIGTRSAVFAPMKNLGVIIVDEEADSCYKQDQLPRYHGRDVAVRRAHMLDIPIVLGSATPSLESYYNATIHKRYNLLTITSRVENQRLPKVEIVDMNQARRQRAQAGDHSTHLLSPQLENALTQTFHANGQAILLLNKRGYANYIMCPDHNCDWVMKCDHCDVTMVYHINKQIRSGGYVRCHYCGFENRLPVNCPVCHKKLIMFGLGTQRVEKELARKFPNTSITRMDSDTMRDARSYQNTFRKFHEGEIDMLVGTQMIAKGLDFPNVRLVGVISADTALNIPDFRATERTFNLISQVAGRCGRSDKPGLVIVQTMTPSHPSIRQAADHDYVAFANMEITQRQLANLPPFTRMARIVIRDQNFTKCTDNATQLAQKLNNINQSLSLNAQIQGPMPPPIARIADYFRQQIQITCNDAAQLQKLITAARSAKILRSDARIAVDVDPISLL